MDLVFNQTAYTYEEPETEDNVCVMLRGIDEIVAGLSVIATVTVPNTNGKRELLYNYILLQHENVLT